VAQERKKIGKWSGFIKSLDGYPPWIRWIIWAFLLSLLSFVLYVGYLDSVIRERFEGKRWSLPAVVYARPLELYPGLAISIQELEDELLLAGYRRDKRAEDPGGYERQGRVIQLVTRDFTFPDGLEKSGKYTLYFTNETLVRISRTESGEMVEGLRLDPPRIGSFHPKQHEDRIVLSRSELPELLVKSLLAVEDHNFFKHSGLDLRAILRALLANIMAGETVQGGSTLTQQLVKNFFLSNERTIWRKFNEAIMALLLEAHYDKDEILTAYANEIFLGQDGGRAVHGFGLASFFYFRRELGDLSPAQTATLVGLVQGPSYYNPRKYSDRCLKRRQVVLEVMLNQKVIDEDTYTEAKFSPLITEVVTANAFNRFPAFLDLVRRQLTEDYREETLTSDGLKIFSTLDPQVQKVVEGQFGVTIARLEGKTGISNLEGAVIVTRRESGEVLAVVGGRTFLQSGFNRAIAARRQVGSLVKPAVYLAALGKGYTLATPVDDTALIVHNIGDEPWSPENFDRIEHGRIPMYLGLAYSMNLATVRIGMDVGVEEVVQTLKGLGVVGDFPAYPSFLLGAASLTPLEVTQMYQTLASGGFYLPQRVISTVLAADNTVVKRFGISVEQRFPPAQVYLLNSMLQHVVSEGTAKSLSRFLARSYKVAGKTGTSDDLRDSWFAGFTGDKLAVVWLGRDDNNPTGLTGASGALEVWGEIMRALHPQPLDLVEPEGIKWQWLKPETFELSSFPFLFAPGQVKLPFIVETLPGRDRFSVSGSQDSPGNGD